jgi:3-deoxy-D-manno-octulosonate 8-phosphate phosphatase (KDO 8-P phosphatase)
MLSMLKDITTFILDVDGVLTDGGLLVTEKGEELRVMSIKDGYAMRWAIKQGYKVAVISGKRSEGVIRRLQNLGLNDIYVDITNKVDAYNEFIGAYNLNADNILYIGDDIPDMQVMKKVGVAACPADASEEIRNISHYISPFNGGQGCVRDVIEKVMKLQNKWDNPGA